MTMDLWTCSLSQGSCTLAWTSVSFILPWDPFISGSTWKTDTSKIRRYTEMCQKWHQCYPYAVIQKSMVRQSLGVNPGMNRKQETLVVRRSNLSQMLDHSKTDAGRKVQWGTTMVIWAGPVQLAWSSLALPVWQKNQEASLIVRKEWPGHVLQPQAIAWRCNDPIPLPPVCSTLGHSAQAHF